MVDLRSPSKSSGRQNGTINRPSGVQKLKIGIGAAHMYCRVPGTDLVPESIRIGVLMICCRFIIDLGSLFCNRFKFVDGFAVVLGTLFKQNLTKRKICFTADGQGSD